MVRREVRLGRDALASLPYLSPDQVKFRRTVSTRGGTAAHRNPPGLLANRRLACVVAGLVKLADSGFDSHALPPSTSRNFYCWGASEAPVSKPSPRFATGASSSLIADSRAAGDRRMYLRFVLRCWCRALDEVETEMGIRKPKKNFRGLFRKQQT